MCAHLSAYGRTGPRASWPGFDYLMQAEAGWFSLTGEPDGPPARFGLSVVDLMTGLGLSYAVAAGIVSARASGEGRDLDVSLFDMALHNLCYPAAWYLNEGHVVERLPRSAHPSLTPCQLYRTADGWIYIMCNKEKFWPALCGKLDRPEWIADPRFVTFTERLENRDTVTEILDEALSARTTAKWLDHFAGVVPAAPINDIAEALDNTFVAERSGIQHLTHPVRGGHPSRRSAGQDRRTGTESCGARPGRAHRRTAGGDWLRLRGDPAPARAAGGLNHVAPPNHGSSHP